MVGVVVALPQLFELTVGYFDSKNAPDLVNVVVSSILLAGAVFLTYRWLTFHASVSSREIRISKLFWTVSIPVEQFGEVELQSWQENSTYFINSKSGKRLTAIPSTLTLSSKFSEFLNRLKFLSAASRSAAEQGTPFEN